MDNSSYRIKLFSKTQSSDLAKRAKPRGRKSLVLNYFGKRTSLYELPKKRLQGHLNALLGKEFQLHKYIEYYLRITFTWLNACLFLNT